MGWIGIEGFETKDCATGNSAPVFLACFLLAILLSAAVLPLPSCCLLAEWSRPQTRWSTLYPTTIQTNHLPLARRIALHSFLDLMTVTA